MRMILAAFAALLALASSPASAYPNTDDRYFDSRARVNAAAYKRTIVHRTAYRHVSNRHGRKVGSRRDKTVPMPRARPGTVRDYMPVIIKGDFAPISRTAILGGRPAGCPRAFCGCGASLHLFGRIIPALNLAANWLRFPRAVPAPGMAAARHGHVFVLKHHIEGKRWMVFDANSGGHRTRLHPRSIAGFTIVNPRAGAS